MPHDAVLMMSFGGPAGMEEVRPFLERVLRGVPVRPGRIDEMVEKYRAVGGVSPVGAVTRAQADALEGALREDGIEMPVHVAMRNWEPSIRDTLARMGDAGVRRALGLVMTPHRSETSTGRYEKAVEEARGDLGEAAPEVEYPAPWHEEPLYIEAIAGRVREALETIPEEDREETPWIFTAHSIPLAEARSSTYVQDLSQTIELVAEEFSPLRWRLAYQSRSGSPEAPWLGPDVYEAIGEEASPVSTAGPPARGVLVIPVGFVADNVEILYDLDRAAATAAHEAGLRYTRAGTVGTHPSFIRMLAGVASRMLRE